MFTGAEDQQIDLTQAHALTIAFQTANPGAIKAQYFSRAILEKILAQSDCVGIRVHNGLNTEGVQSSVLSGVLANGNDITDGVLGDRSILSPPHTGAANPLNS